jgi:hypothetical protein
MTRKITFKLLRPDEVWQPKVGPPFGSRNAIKTGAHTAEVRAWRARVHDWRKRVRAALAQTERDLSCPPESPNPAGWRAGKPAPRAEGFPSHLWKILIHQWVPIDDRARL